MCVFIYLYYIGEGDTKKNISSPARGPFDYNMTLSDIRNKIKYIGHCKNGKIKINRNNSLDG